MKRLFTSKLLLTMALPLMTTEALSHTGHLSNDTVHSFIHAEHLIVISAIGLIVYVINLLRDR